MKRSGRIRNQSRRSRSGRRKNRRSISCQGSLQKKKVESVSILIPPAGGGRTRGIGAVEKAGVVLAGGTEAG